MRTTSFNANSHAVHSQESICQLNTKPYLIIYDTKQVHAFDVIFRVKLKLKSYFSSLIGPN